MKDNKKYIVIIVIIIIYALAALIIFGLNGLKFGINKIYMVLSPNFEWMLSGGKWQDVSEQTSLYNWQKYNVFIDNESLGTYNVLYNEKWYLFDENKNSIDYQGRLFGYRGNTSINVINFDYQNIGGQYDSILNDVLDEQKIDETKNWTVSKKIEIDLDNDGQNEYIYTFSNLFNYKEFTSEVYSILFIYDNNKITFLQKDIDTKENEYNYCIESVRNIIDINNDKKYELITGCNYFDRMGSCAQLYSLNSKGVYTSNIKTCNDSIE